MREHSEAAVVVEHTVANFGHPRPRNGEDTGVGAAGGGRSGGDDVRTTGGAAVERGRRRAAAQRGCMVGCAVADAR